MFKRILVGVDSSEPAERAVKMAAELAQKENDSLVALMHVIDPPKLLDVNMVVDARDGQDYFARKAEEMLRGLHRHFPAGARLEYFVMEGRPAEQIVGAAARWRADLIIVGDHNRHSLSRFILGSVADAVVRHAPCAVLIAREPDVAPHKVSELAGVLSVTGEPVDSEF